MKLSGFSLDAALLNLILLINGVSAKAQDGSNSITQARNSINGYVGLIEYNVNYERNIIRKSNSYSNIRLGFGHGQFLVAGEGQYVNAGFVHLRGRKNAHLEIDLGVKCMVTNTIDDPAFSDTVLPDVFLGFRFEKSAGGFIFRAGVNYPTVINVGIGYKF